MRDAGALEACPLLDGHVTLPFPLDGLNAKVRAWLRGVGALSDAQH